VDYKVLLVDVRAIPAAANAFLPMMKRSDVALNVAVAILGCWNAARQSGSPPLCLDVGDGSAASVRRLPCVEVSGG
jgi:hypothetical protein